MGNSNTTFDPDKDIAVNAFFSSLFITFAGFCFLGLLHFQIKANYAGDDALLTAKCATIFHEFYQEPEVNILDETTITKFNNCIDIVNTMQEQYATK